MTDRDLDPERLARLRAMALHAPVGAPIRTVLTPSLLELDMWMRNEVSHARPTPTRVDSRASARGLHCGLSAARYLRRVTRLVVRAVGLTVGIGIVLVAIGVLLAGFLVIGVTDYHEEKQ